MIMKAWIRKIGLKRRLRVVLGTVIDKVKLNMAVTLFENASYRLYDEAFTVVSWNNDAN